uniref:NADH-ubiquinone oxidoreductase chain 2 n=1 Tax=Thermobia sp. XL-2019 TaxID=2682733 RepID=A0A6C0R1H5_9INSE|nr:NADH dehydrogenase subunit 2 [Thermobia sp. XL-2019]
MLTNPKMLMFLSTLMVGSLISVSATSWYGAWMGLEINLLSFIPLTSKTNNQRMTESALKYFLTQALASTILLTSIILMSYQTYITNNVSHIMMTTSLALKLGAGPLHFWMPEVMEGLTWTNCMLLMTWQKLAPLTLMSYFSSDTPLIFLFIISSVLFGSIGGLNQTSLRKIMAFSSINHAGWLLAAMLYDDASWFLYFNLYVFLTLMSTALFNANKLYHFNQTFTNKINPPTKLAIFTSLLSLGGLPPFLGFLPKWIIIMKMTCSLFILTTMILVMTTLITLYYYIRISYSAFILLHTNQSWTKMVTTPNQDMLATTIIIISLTGLITTPLIINLSF